MARNATHAHHRSWKFLGIVLLLAIVAIAGVILYEFTDVLLLGLALAYIVYPVAKWFNRVKPEPGLRYLISSLAAVGVIAIPLLLSLFYGLNFVFRWFINNLSFIRSGRFLSDLKLGLNEAGLDIVSDRVASEIGKLLVSFSDTIGASILNPTLLVSFLVKFAVFFIAAFYFVYEGPQIRKALDKHIPAREKFLQELLISFDKIAYGLFVGHFFTSVIIALIFGAGYWVIFRPDLLFLGLLTIIMFVIAFLPVIGPWLMYIPLGIWSIIFSQSATGATQGIALLVFGIIFLTLIPDFYIRPKLIQKGAEIHPLLIILGFFGGPLVMGIKGIIIGPLILGLAQAMISLYIKKRHILKELVEHF